VDEVFSGKIRSSGKKPLLPSANFFIEETLLRFVIAPLLSLRRPQVRGILFRSLSLMSVILSPRAGEWNPFFSKFVHK